MAAAPRFTCNFFFWITCITCAAATTDVTELPTSTATLITDNTVSTSTLYTFATTTIDDVLSKGTDSYTGSTATVPSVPQAVLSTSLSPENKTQQSVISTNNKIDSSSTLSNTSTVLPVEGFPSIGSSFSGSPDSATIVISDTTDSLTYMSSTTVTFQSSATFNGTTEILIEGSISTQYDTSSVVVTNSSASTDAPFNPLNSDISSTVVTPNTSTDATPGSSTTDLPLSVSTNTIVTASTATLSMNGSSSLITPAAILSQVSDAMLKTLVVSNTELPYSSSTTEPAMSTEDTSLSASVPGFSDLTSDTSSVEIESVVTTGSSSIETSEYFDSSSTEPSGVPAIGTSSQSQEPVTSSASVSLTTTSTIPVESSAQTQHTVSSSVSLESSYTIPAESSAQSSATSGAVIESTSGTSELPSMESTSSVKSSSMQSSTASVSLYVSSEISNSVQSTVYSETQIVSSAVSISAQPSKITTLPTVSTTIVTTPSFASTTPGEESPAGPLSTGAGVAIALCVILVVVLAIGGGVFYYRRCYHAKRWVPGAVAFTKPWSFTNASYHDDENMLIMPRIRKYDE